MKRLSMLVALLLLAACSSSDYDEPAQGRGPESRMPPARGEMRGVADTVLGPMPLDNWWHDPQLAEPLALTADQYSSLDRIQAQQGDEIARLQRDSMVALRDFQQSLTSEKPMADDIVTAGDRVRSLRDKILERQVRLIAAERIVLTNDQWQKLQQQLRENRDDWRQNRNIPGGRGGRGGRGGWGGGMPGGRRGGFGGF